MFLEFDCSGGLFNAKMPNYKKNSFWYPPVQTPMFQALTQNSAPYFFLASNPEVSKKGMSHRGIEVLRNMFLNSPF
jgi:hypothetical protein